MENLRRPIDRSKEPILKRPRLIKDPRHAESSAPMFPQRQQQVTSASRFRQNDTDVENNEDGYQPQPLPFQELVAQYKSGLAELTFNSKLIINNLTRIADENRAAEKAIAATICANILEVPSEQKLPSLYLLDSIVKNIGRDYIKFFAAKLPEVFCKAYKQVEPPVRQSMKHLFGTWKGVFPPQTLQAIDKELGFTPAVNGSSSASAALRSDSQTHHPSHSIHVNPKYFERQRVQESSRSNQHTHRDPFNDPVPEKSISASYGGGEHGSNLSRNMGMGIGRTDGSITELGHRNLYNKAAGVSGTISGQRNGVGLKHSFSNTEATTISDAQHQPTRNITGIKRNAMSNSWKNSEEEEYMWDDMNIGLTSHGVRNNLGNDAWTADDENLDAEENHHQIRNVFGTNVDREMTNRSQATQKKQFRHHPSLSWKLQEHQSIDELDQELGPSDGCMSISGSLLGNANSSAARMGNRAFLPNARIGGQQFHSVGSESISGQSPLRQRSPSPPSIDHSHLIENFDKQDHPHSRKTSQFLGGLQSKYIKDSSPTLSPNIQVGDLRRSSQVKDLQGPLPSASFQPRYQQQLSASPTEVNVKTKKLPLSNVSLARETSEQPATSHTEIASVKSRLFSNMPITSNLPSLLGSRPSQSGGSSPATLISSVSANASPSSSALPKRPQRKAGQSIRTSTLPPASSNVSSASAQTLDATNKTSNPLSNLLSSLVAKGLISTETETPAEVVSRSEDYCDSFSTSSSMPVASLSGSAVVPVPSTKDELDDTAKTSTSLSESTSTDIRNVIGFEFKPNVIRKLHPSVISGLFDDFPHHCSICGLKLKLQEQFNRHLEWHATREREHSGLTKASRWYLKSTDWVAGQAECSSENEFTDSVDSQDKETDESQEDAMVLADENQCLCVLCGELFEDVYCQENSEWMFKGAVYVTNSDSDTETGIKDTSSGRGPIIHTRCLSDNSLSSVLKMEQD
ncbi:polyadenylation and cleavage factor homolog 4-like [Vicia villosa]|uniref:polyadenylation and cleavage factor homolog 4-like n=1 Tax=Vicia villosa TaxID=3911 RepID=UPI00273AA780|nr:polyadenylation and cleavage factor homolog 4-like [Vicia villosa]